MGIKKISFMRYKRNLKKFKEIDFEDWTEEETPITNYEYYILQVYVDYLFFIKENEKFYCLHFIDENITNDDIMISDHGIKIISVNNHKLLCTDYTGSDEIYHIKNVDNDNIDLIVNGQIDILNDLSNGYDRYFKYNDLKNIVHDEISFKL